MKTFTTRFMTAFMALIMIVAMSVPAYAAGGKTDPYGFTWMDETNDIWCIQYYVYDKSERSYIIKDSVSLDGDHLFDINGNLISDDVYEMDSKQSEAYSPTAAFDSDGKLYFIDNDGKVCRMSSSTSKTYTKSTSVSNAKAFELNSDDLAYKVSSKKLSSLSFSGEYNREGTTVTPPSSGNTDKKGDYVISYAVDGDFSKIAYDAYLNDKLLISVYCKGSNVWVNTAKVLLSETCVGAKFVGYSHDYYTILYDLDGTVYAFAHDNFDKALPISLGEEIMSYKKDDNGFIESITTSRKTYNLDELLDKYGYDDSAYDIDYVKNTSSTSTAYTAYDNKVSVLEKNGNYLYWNGNKLSNSYRTTYLGITEEGYPVWINNDGDLYYYNGSKTKLIKENVTRMRYDIDGFAFEYKKGTKTYQFDF